MYLIVLHLPQLINNFQLDSPIFVLPPSIRRHSLASARSQGTALILRPAALPCSPTYPVFKSPECGIGHYVRSVNRHPKLSDSPDWTDSVCHQRNPTRLEDRLFVPRRTRTSDRHLLTPAVNLGRPPIILRHCAGIPQPAGRGSSACMTSLYDLNSAAFCDTETKHSIYSLSEFLSRRLYLC